ncbi:MAG: glycosyltransferase [bacterium]|nr:glycosyltransferase [bacterium]
MTLLYISNARIPTEKAHGIHIMKMCEVFAIEGFRKSLNTLRDFVNPSIIEVELVIPRRFNKIKKDPFDYYGINPNFKIKKLPCLDLIPLDKYLGYLALWLESLSFTLAVFFYLIFKKADIIYTRDKSLLFLSFFKKNIIFESHTFPRNYFLYQPFLKRLKGIVVITQKLNEQFGGGALVAPDGVDLEQFDIRNTKEECRKKLNLPLDKKIVLYTGHLYQWKGVDVLAEASQYLPENVEVYFVGGTVEDIHKFKIQNTKYKIHVVGHRPYAEIPYWLKAADILVLPNSAKKEISKHWTSPLKMFEYMASGRPIVASDLPSIREVLNEENAVLVEPDNPQKLADGIKKVLEDELLSDRISKKAYSDVAENYTWRRRRKKIFEFFNINADEKQ